MMDAEIAPAAILPAFYVTGHRGRHSLRVTCFSRAEADSYCSLYFGLGYRHLRIWPIAYLAAEPWRRWSLQRHEACDEG